MNLASASAKRRWTPAVITTAAVAVVLAIASVVLGFASIAKADPPLTNCYPILATCGYPTLDSVGPRTGHTLVEDDGVLETTSDNQVIEDLDLTGCIVVQNEGVIIRDVKIHGDCFYGIQIMSGDATISYVDISCEDGVDTGIAFSNFSVDHAYIHRCENGIYVENNVSLTDSIIQAYEGAPDISHTDLVQGSAGSNVVIDHNLLAGLNPSTSAIIADVSVSNWTITDNFMSGGAYELYCPTTASSVTITGNRFYPVAEDLADVRGPAFGNVVNCTTSGITWSGNYIDSTGDTLDADGTT